jgi:RHS repeat-associated protein
MVLDPFDYLPFIGATVQVAGVKRATAGTGGLSVHIPLALWVPFLRAPGGPQFDDELFMGSKTVLADDSPFSRLGMPVLDCSVVGMVPPFRLKKPEKPHMSMSMPTAVNLAIPDTVFIGGPPTISMMAIATKLGFAALGKGFKALRKTKGFQRAEEAFKKARQRLFKNMEPGFLKCKVLRAEPVDIRDGSVSVVHEDFFIPGRLPLNWTRVYSSNCSYEGICGYGWQTPADFRLEIEPDGMVLFFEANGAAVFPHLPEAAGADHAVTEFVDGARLSWMKNGDADELHVVTKDDLRYVFHRPSPNTSSLHQVLLLQIEKIEDLCGNHWRFERVDGHLTRIIESGINGLPGRFVEVHESSGKIHQLSLHDPATGLNHSLVAYKYLGQDLSAVLDALNAARTFEYDRHHMVRHADRLGLSFYYAYDGEWRVMHAWGDQGLHDYRFAYDAVLRETEVRDSLGHISLIKFDEDNLPLCEVDPLGGVTIFEYDEVGRTIAIVDPIGSRTEFEYDDRGNLLKLLQPDGSVTVMFFDDANRMTEVIDPVGNHWKQGWDARGLLLEQTTPMGGRSQLIYNANGQLQIHINPRGAATELTFDRYGCISKLTDALGHSTYFEHNGLGLLIRRTDPANDVVEYRYDVKSRLLQTSLADGTNLRYDYDQEDRLTGYADQSDAWTKLEYVGTNQLARRTTPDGHAIQYFYDTEERLVGLTNQRKESYQLKRDALGRIIEEIDYWGQSRQYNYRANGGLLNTTDPLGRIIAYDTDRLGRIVKKTFSSCDDPGAQIGETFNYDKNGALIEMRNRHRHVLRKFDADGCLVEEIQDGFRIESHYDQAGNRLIRQTSAGNKVISTFDLCDQVASISFNDEPPVLIERDALGRIVKEQLSASLQRQLSYGVTGHLTAQTVLRDQVSLFATTYDYDRAGNQIRRSDTEHGNDVYQYDSLGNILRHIDPAKRIKDFLNDPVGDRLATRIQQKEMQQVVGAEGQADVLWTREGSCEGARYVFDRAGNLVRREFTQSPSINSSGAHESLQLRWDANQRLIESKQAGQVTRYGYDPLGRRVFKRNLTHTTWFYWDGDALLGDVQQVNDSQNQDVWAAGNVADLTAVRRRLKALKEQHGCVREFVYYPGTFVPLALITGHASGSKQAANAESNGRRNAEASLSRDGISASPSSHARSAPGFGGMGGLGSVILGRQNEPDSHGTHLAAAGPALHIGLGSGATLGGRSYTSPVAYTPAVVVPLQRTLAEMESNEVKLTMEDSCNRVFLYHNDPNGCPTRLTDNSGRVVWSVGYTAWGQVQQLHVDLIDNPIRYQGQYHDDETGLHYNRYRYYDPNIGQFVGQDPIGLAGGDNPYQYALNPISWIDPLGLTCLKWNANARRWQNEAGKFVRLPTRNFFDNALSLQNLKKAPASFKEKWQHGGFKFEVRAHPANASHGHTGSIYRVSRQTPGQGTEYMDIYGKWHHQSTLKDTFADGSKNPNFNPTAAAETHIPY